MATTAAMHAYNRSGATWGCVAVGSIVGVYTRLAFYGFDAVDKAKTPASAAQALGRSVAIGMIAGGIVGYTAPVSVPLLLLMPSRVFGEERE